MLRNEASIIDQITLILSQGRWNKLTLRHLPITCLSQDLLQITLDVIAAYRATLVKHEGK